MGVLEPLRDALKATPLVGEDDEFDPFAGRETEPPPADEGDDRVHADGAPADG